MTPKISKTNTEWQDVLDEETYYITREKGTERPFSGKYNTCKDEGIYRCICCDNALFGSGSKYDSGSGWPSFFAPLKKDVVDECVDASHGMARTEITCSQCGAHLGHVFADGPQPTGLRYCVNSASLNFDKKE
ncbi:MAG: peptide-methionine (R)-S-oxide reductase MsrB [Alphaproteobacteria bacterium]|nr:peptide-methionine (R)-S-oxide reductase MsrB [Alphaproteobacteria bacterium]